MSRHIALWASLQSKIAVLPYVHMRSSALGKWILVCGAVLCGLAIGLSFYADTPGGAYNAKIQAETWCYWFLLAGLLAVLLGAILWAVRATAARSVLAALCSAASGALLFFFGHISVHGATGIFLPIVIASVPITFVLGVIALVQYFKPKLGRKAHSLAVLAFALAGIGLFAEFKKEQPNEGPPKVLTAAELPKLIRNLPQRADFSITGLSLFDGRLYVGTNLGIVEVLGGEVTQLDQFQPTDSVVSGPWLDRANHLLWATDDHTNELLRFDGKKWTRMQEPVPEKGSYTRGDMLEGLRPTGNIEGFWLTAGGTAWRWNSGAVGWDAISRLEAARSGNAAIIGVLPIEDTALLIVRREALPMLPRPNGDFESDEVVNSSNSAATPIVRGGRPFLADSWTVSGDAGYICTKGGDLVRVTYAGVAPLSAPGACEAVTSDDNMSLIVSFKSKGVFRYDRGQWTLIAESPYPSGAGDYWTYLSTSSGQLALAIDAKPVVAPGYTGSTDMHFVANAPTSLWVLQDRKFVPIKF